MSFVEKVEQLNQEIGASFDRALSALRQEMRDRLRDSHQDLERGLDAFRPPLARPFVAHEDLAPVADRMRTEARGAAFEELRDAIAGLDRARTQSEVLTALLAGAGQVASRAALLLVRGGGLRGWGGHGFADSEKALHDLVLAPPGDSSWSRLAQPAEDGEGGASGTGGASQDGATAAASGASGASAAAGPVRLSAAECAVLCGPIESPVPAYGYLVPLVLRDRTVAALYADQSPDGEDGPVLPALQLLVYVAALTIESLPFRQRAATATLAPPPPLSPAAPAPAAPVADAGVAASAPPATGEQAVVEEPAEPVATGEPAAAAEAAVAGTTAAAMEAALAHPEIPELQQSAVAEPPAEAAAPAAPEPEHGAAAPETQAPAAAETAPPASGSPALSGDDTHPGVQSGGAPYVVTPATLYDAPRAPLAVKATAELQVPRTLRPLPALPPLEEAPAGESPSAGAPQGAPQDGGEAVRGGPAAIEAPAAAGADGAGGGLDTQLLPHAALREAGTPGTQTLGGLRAVPPAAFSPGGASQSAAAAPPSSAGATTAAIPPESSPTPHWPPPLSTAPAIPAAPAFEPARTGPIGTGTPEVRPPSGVQGPGWAFATTRVQATSGEEALHEEARRLARLLVSEIKLYNEEQVEAGRRNRDIYERLREDIDRSRQMYEERVDPRLVKSTDYFYQELVRILAAGDPKALGI